MRQMTIDIPEEFAQEISRYQDRLREVFLLGLLQLKIQESLLLYERGLVSFGRAAELVGLSRDDMARHARAIGIRPQFSDAMVTEELA